MARPSIKKYFEKGKVVEVTYEEHDTIPLPAITFCPMANDRETKILSSKILYIYFFISSSSWKKTYSKSLSSKLEEFCGQFSNELGHFVSKS